MYYLHQILENAFNGASVSRNGWLHRFHLEVTASYSCPVLLRVADDGSFSAPWSPTEDDMFTQDWQLHTTEPTVSSTVGSYSWALDKLINSENSSVRLSEWHEKMEIKMQITPQLGRFLAISFPNGKTAIYRPASQDLAATNWESC